VRWGSAGVYVWVITDMTRRVWILSFKILLMVVQMRWTGCWSYRPARRDLGTRAKLEPWCGVSIFFIAPESRPDDLGRCTMRVGGLTVIFVLGSFSPPPMMKKLSAFGTASLGWRIRCIGKNLPVVDCTRSDPPIQVTIMYWLYSVATYSLG